jgi:hypothetical protein
MQQMQMEKTKEENDKIYILGSRQNIDNFINKNEYKKAFGLLILVLERLDFLFQNGRLKCKKV